MMRHIFIWVLYAMMLHLVGDRLSHFGEILLLGKTTIFLLLLTPTMIKQMDFHLEYLLLEPSGMALSPMEVLLGLIGIQNGNLR